MAARSQTVTKDVLGVSAVKTPLDRPLGRFYDIHRSALRSGPEFHAEWLRDEPIDATATETGSSIPLDRCQLSPGNGDHEIWD